MCEWTTKYHTQNDLTPRSVFVRQPACLRRRLPGGLMASDVRCTRTGLRAGDPGSLSATTRLAHARVNAEADAQTRSFSAMLPFLPPVGRPADAPGGAAGSCCGSTSLAVSLVATASAPCVGAVVRACPPSAPPSCDDMLAGATWGYLV